MKVRIKLVLIMTCLFYSSGALAMSTWSAYFPTNKVLAARVMAAAPETPQVQAVKAKLKTVKALPLVPTTTAEGQPQPFNSVSGLITEPEYEIFLASEQQKLRQVGNVQLTFTKVDAEHLKINTLPESPINGIVIAMKEVTTPLGILSYQGPVDFMNQQTHTGAWKGMVWRLGEGGSHKSLVFAIGKLQSTGEDMIYFHGYSEPTQADINYVICYN